ncbi:MAG TPA: DUF2171 domain-containing protein [Sphingomonas sp.]|jgi:hypothetical protein|uniref:DUF2171 domain-containing protein n=1 Tax=Sphingomonas sp. TaxID=28214 RepID=UPI002ED8432A
MAYERDEDGYGRGRMGERYGARSDRDRGPYGYGPERGRGDRERGPAARGPDYRGGRRDYGGQPQGYDYEDRGFFERTADEVRSWFGDEEAERRRHYDERYGDREQGRYGERDAGQDRSGGYRERDRSSDGDYGVGVPRSSGGRYAGGGVGAPGFGGQGRSDFGGGPTGGGDFGAGRGAGATMAYGLGAGQDREQWGHDPNYRSWRDRQVESFDRDYDEYRREHQSKFESEFATWRTGRQTQREALNKVQEHQEVVGSDGAHVGTVDKVRGDQIILTKNDQDAGGHHHAIPSSWIDQVDDRVILRKSSTEAKAHWRDIERNSPMFGGNQDRDRANATSPQQRTADDATGPHALNRSFPGTY